MMGHRLAVIFLLCSCLCMLANVTVTDVSVKPRWPWNGLVDITYSIECDETDEKGQPKDVYVTFTGVDNVRNQKITLRTLTGKGAKAAVRHGGPYTVTWDAGKDCPNMDSAAFSVRIDALAGFGPYMVVDLSGGPNASNYPVRYSSQPPNLDDDTCRTTELWLRQIPAGKFIMGSPSNEVGRWNNMDMAQHEVTITQMYYIGVFECTQKQWELVMGNNPSDYLGDCRPVVRVSYEMIRGTETQAGAGWPAYDHAVDASSFMGKLQERTGLTFDLPTEAQWEYACRASTTTALYSGKNLTNPDSRDSALDEIARYQFNNSDGKGGYSEHTKVGSYLPNAWELYDMVGNVIEWSLDWWGASTSSGAAETDPIGSKTGEWRVIRGGHWYDLSRHCRSASRGYFGPQTLSSHCGFRIVNLPLN